MTAVSKEEIQNLNLKYYNPEIHKASFILPEFVRKVSHESNSFPFGKFLLSVSELLTLSFFFLCPSTGTQLSLTSNNRPSCSSSTWPSDHRSTTSPCSFSTFSVQIDATEGSSHVKIWWQQVISWRELRKCLFQCSFWSYMCFFFWCL